MTINQRLKYLREQSGLTLDEVSKHVGVTKQTVQKYESGVVVSIPSDKIEILAKVYDVTPGFIMGWDDEQPSTPIADGFKTAYDKLTPEKQQLVDQMIQAMLDKP